MRPIMPWFLPFAVGLAVAGTRIARDLYRERGRNNPDGHVMLVLTWSPLLVWVVTQWTAKF